MAEEALLGALESRQRGGLGILVEGGIALHDAGGFERVFHIAVDHLEGPGIGVVDAPLFGRERMFERLDLDPVIAERTGLVEPDAFRSRATTSIAATPPASMAVTKSVRCSKGVSPPEDPRRPTARGAVA